jgi:hypothetical protein
MPIGEQIENQNNKNSSLLCILRFAQGQNGKTLGINVGWGFESMRQVYAESLLMRTGFLIRSTTTYILSTARKFSSAQNSGKENQKFLRINKIHNSVLVLVQS